MFSMDCFEPRLEQRVKNVISPCLVTWYAAWILMLRLKLLALQVYNMDIPKNQHNASYSKQFEFEDQSMSLPYGMSSESLNNTIHNDLPQM